MKRVFPLIALGIGLLLSLILLRFSPLAADAGQGLPLLTALLASEIGFLITAIAAIMGVREAITQRVTLAGVLVLLGNLVLVVNFARMGLALWPETASG